MDKQPVGQLPDLASSNNDDEIMVITNSEYSQLKKEKISDLITDFTSTNENNALTKGTDGKLFVTDFGNASNITEGTLPVSVLPDIPKDKLPDIEITDLPESGVTADTYAYPSSVTVNSQGQVTAIEAGAPGANNANQDLSNLSETGEKHFINKTQITNCILEIPQVVDLQLNGEVLTVKSGTKLYDASGTVATLNNDRTVTLTLTTKTQCYVLINKSTQGITTANVTDSRLTFTDNKVIFADVEYYLPLGLVTRDVAGKSTLDQVFNGSGYILNNCFILPNVKGLYPNYRNEDGTLKNGTAIIPNVLIKSSSSDGNYYLIARETDIFFIDKRFYYYNQEENMAYRTSDNTVLQFFDFAEATINGSKITEFKPRYTFQAVDYNDFAELKENSANKELTNLTNGLANVICTTAPAVKGYGFIKYGSLTEDDNNFTGFSSTNYAQINTYFAPSNLPWEMNFLVSTSTNVNSEQEILSDRNNRLEIEIIESRFALEVFSGSTIKGTYTVLPSTVYYIKVRFTGTQYILSYSLNGTSYTDDVIITNSNTYDGSSDLYIGKDYNNNNNPWLGAINKNYGSIIVNNQLLWQVSAPTSNVYPTAQNPAVVVDGYINGTSGYRVWSDGFCEQWGYVLSVNKTTTITLLKKMIDTNYSITCTGTEATGEKDNGSMNAYNPTTTEFNIYNTSDNVSNCYWKATGYIS